MRRSLRALMTVALVVVAACADDADDPLAEVPDAPSTTSPSSVDAGSDGADRGQVTLLDPGAEPRQVLRLDPPDDCEQLATLTQEQEQSITVDGQGTETSTAGNAFDLRYRCTEVTDEAIEVRSEYLDARLLHADAASRSTMEDVLDAFEGATGRVRYDHFGAVLDVEAPDLDLAGPLGAVAGPLLEGLGDSLRQAAAPFPREAVGRGARWEHELEVDVSGLRMRQTTAYTVTKIAEDRVVADTTIRMEVVPGEVDYGELGVEGASAEVVSGSFTGTGTASWDLDGVVAFADQDLQGSTEMVVRSPDGTEVRLVQEQRQRTSLAPADAPSG